MALVKPFKALRPKNDLAAKVAAPPYDVLSSKEAREMAKNDPLTFLHVNKPEIDLPEGIDVYSADVYNKGAQNLQRMISDGILIRERKECFYLYRQVMGNHTQTGLVALASVEEYNNNIIKKHEFTRPLKEDDRVNHIDHLNAQVGPVFLTFKSNSTIGGIFEIKTRQIADVDFTAKDGIRHVVWTISETELINDLQNAFAAIPFLYVADGHHRSAAASRIAKMRREKNPNHTGNESYNFFLTVIFPHDQMYIMDYNRVVKDLNGNNKEEFLTAIEKNFEINKDGKEAAKPTKKNIFKMYLDGEWYSLSAHNTLIDKNDPVLSLDVSVLQQNLLNPVLGIGDPRKDPRIDFVGGIRGLEGLKKRVDSGEMKVAFALHPTSIEELMAIADANEVMPPKSTWFEPKLRSGLFVNVLD